MKKRFICLTVLAMAAGAFFFSCTEGKKKQIGNMETDSINVNQTAHLIAGSTSPSCNIVIDYVFPTKMEDEAVCKSINRELLSACFGQEYAKLSPKAAVDSFLNTYISSYREELIPLYREDLKNIKEEDSVPGWYSYYYTLAARPKAGSPAYISYQIDQYDFSGGAHGNYSTTFLNFDLKNGSLLALDDIFLPGYKTELNRLLLHQLMQQTETSNMDQLQQKAYLQISDMFPAENFLIDKEGILFFYNVYEIAPYSNGTTEIFLSYESLKELLKQS